METYVCQRCGRECARQPTKGQRPKWCADPSCRREREAERRRAGYRSGRHAAPAPKGPWQGTRECRLCGVTFDARTARARVCYAEECQLRKHADRQCAFQQKYSAEHGKTYQHDKYPEERRAYTLARKAIYRGAPEAALIRRETLAERDGWGCQICGDPIDPALVFPEPMSASIDHKHPLSLGGAHTLDNVQLAHLGCNSRKSNRV